MSEKAFNLKELLPPGPPWVQGHVLRLSGDIVAVMVEPLGEGWWKGLVVQDGRTLPGGERYGVGSMIHVDPDSVASSRRVDRFEVNDPVRQP